MPTHRSSHRIALRLRRAGPASFPRRLPLVPKARAHIDELPDTVAGRVADGPAEKLPVSRAI